MNIIEIPKTCPICQAPTIIKDNNGVKTLWCSNEQCDGRLVNKICNFFGKKGLDAKGISKATIEKLIDWGWVNSIKDIFELSKHKEEWKNIQGFGEKSVSNILESIEKCKFCVFESVISAAGIPLIGKTVARDLSKRFNSYEDFRNAIRDGYDFTQFGGYGYEMHKAISTFDYAELDYIVENYLTIEKNNDIIIADKLNGLNFVITGSLDKNGNFKTRDSLKKYIEDNGGKVSSSVSKNTNYLIANKPENTSKYNKALELQIPIIDEKNFEKLLTF